MERDIPGDDVSEHADTIRGHLEPDQEALDALNALLAENQRQKKGLAAAAVVLEVLAGQIRTKPYREMTGDFQGEIMLAAARVREALAGDRE